MCRQADAVALDPKREDVIRLQADVDIVGVGMFEGIVYGFLRDEVQVSCSEMIQHRNGLGGVECAVYFPLLLRALRKVGERSDESLGIDQHGEQPAHDVPDRLLASP